MDQSNTNETDFGDTEVPYKKPLIEMFEDLETLIENDSISNIEVVELYKSTSLALDEDCKRCDDVPEIEELRNLTKSIHEKLSDIMMSENLTSSVSTRRKRSPSFVPLMSEEGQKFKEVSLEKTHEALETADKIPKYVIGKVDVNSTILLGNYYLSSF